MERKAHCIYCRKGDHHLCVWEFCSCPHSLKEQEESSRRYHEEPKK